MTTTNGGAPAGGDSPFPHLAGDLVPWPRVKAALLRALYGDDLFPWPLVKGASIPVQDGGGHHSPPAGYSEAPGRAKYRASRIGSFVVIRAQGDLSNLNELADIRQMPWRILPPQFGFFVYTPEVTQPRVRHFAFSEAFAFPMDATTLVIHDADGPQTIEITEAKSEAVLALLPPPARAEGPSIATGLGASLQDAFDHAVAQLPSIPTHPDQLFVYALIETGLMRGGVAGFHHYYAKVSVKS